MSLLHALATRVWGCLFEDKQGGRGGIQSEVNEPLLSAVEAASVPPKDLKSFCEAYKVDDMIYAMLTVQGFKTATDVAVACERKLMSYGLRSEDIAKLKSALKGLIEDSRPHLMGGVGGKGSASDDIGGSGGAGQGPQLAIEDVSKFRRISGGTGGEGGFGRNKGGTGGTGHGPRIGRRLLPTPHDGKGLPSMPMVKFCREYNLDEDILEPLIEKGYQMSGDLYRLQYDDLINAGFTSGHVGEVMRALGEFVEAVENRKAA